MIYDTTAPIYTSKLQDTSKFDGTSPFYEAELLVLSNYRVMSMLRGTLDSWGIKILEQTSGYAVKIGEEMKDLEKLYDILGNITNIILDYLEEKYSYDIDKPNIEFEKVQKTAKTIINSGKARPVMKQLIKYTLDFVDKNIPKTHTQLIIV